MDKIIEKLKEYGADTDDAMRRFLGDIDLYKTCFVTVLEDETFNELGKALHTADYGKAFECAHTLKGITGNMGLTPLYDLICNVVNQLRNSEYSNLENIYQDIVKQLNMLQEIQKSI